MRGGEYAQRFAAEAVDVARELIAAGRPDVAYQLLRETMQTASAARADTSDIQYWAAQALLAGRHYPQAAELLRRLTKERPDLDRIRLDYAAVLFTLGRDDKSEALFREIRRKRELPPPVQRQVENYLERIRARQRLRFDWETGMWRDNNINNAPEIDAVEIPAFGNLRFTLDQRPVRAWVARTGARLRWRIPVDDKERAYLETHASVTRDTALGSPEFSRTIANISTGPRVHYAVGIAGRRRPGLFRADLGIERRWQGDGSDAAGVWGGLGLELAVGRVWQLEISPRAWVTRHDEGDQGARAQGRSLSLNFSRYAGPGWLTASTKISRQSSDHRTLRWVSQAASLRYAVDVGRYWSIALRTGLIGTKFDGEELLFRKRREDWTQSIGLTASHRGLIWGGYLPEVSFNWSRTSSNIPLYDRERPMVQLGLRRLF